MKMFENRASGAVSASARNVPPSGSGSSTPTPETLAEARIRITKEQEKAANARLPWRPAALPPSILKDHQVIGLFCARSDWHEAGEILSTLGDAPFELCWPRVSENELVFHSAKGPELFSKNSKSLGILEPSPDLPIASPTLLLVPCLTADKFGRRIGRGKGFYDRYLAAHPRSLAIGVIHSNYLIDQLPQNWVQDHDRRLHGLLTETQFLHATQLVRR